MKRVLIAGEGSYIGEAFRRYMAKWPDRYVIESLDVSVQAWRQHDFFGYDTVCMVAGIVHIKENPENQSLFYRVNRDLALEIAQRARDAGVRQYIYLSSMSVYGLTEGEIGRETPLNPKNSYARSKAQAETALQALRTPAYQVAILRIPMVYGRGCKGNFKMVEKIALASPFFPRVYNRRSMIYIGNLCEFLRMAIECNLDGIFFPQNREYVCTYEMARLVARANGKTLYPGYVTGFVIGLMKRYSGTLQKAFGSLAYRDTETSGYAYCLTSFEESIKEMYAEKK